MVRWSMSLNGVITKLRTPEALPKRHRAVCSILGRPIGRDIDRRERIQVRGWSITVKWNPFLLHLTLSSLILGLTAVAALPAFAASAARGDFRGAVEFDGRKLHLE